MFSSYLLIVGLLLLFVIDIEGFLHGVSRRVSTSSSIRPFTSSRLRLSSKPGLEKAPLDLCEENVQIVLNEIRQELGTIFGYDQGSKGVGITGEIDYVDVDGGNVIVSLKGRFWHATDTVMMRVESFMKKRIPEVIDVVLDRERSAIIDDNRLNSENTSKASKKLF